MGLFAALYHLEEWLNCHWKSVKVIFRVGGHFLYLLMAEQNNFWVLGFGVSRTSNQWKFDLLRLPNILKYMYQLQKWLWPISSDNSTTPEEDRVPRIVKKLFLLFYFLSFTIGNVKKNFFYLLLAKHNNVWVLRFLALQINEGVI